MRPSVVIVSNRLPISVKKSEDGKLEFYPSVGGLATGLSSYVKDKRNKWIGWPGIPSDGLSEDERRRIADRLLKNNCYPVFLTQKQLDDYYNGYSNTILWPLFHDLPAPARDNPDYDRFWKAYQAANKAFGDAVLAMSEPDSTIWVHDYQLLTLPAILRAARPRARIGFFLHIPFPDPKNFAGLPSAKVLLAGMLGSDLVGLHTKAYVDNFLGAVGGLTSDVVGQEQVILGDRVVRVTDFPMGIDYDRFTRARELGKVKTEVREYRKKYKGLKVILTVDRLDPTKGLAERLEAYYEFLKQNPGQRGHVVMVMLAVPSRTEVAEYKKLRKRVEGLVTKINTEFGTGKWQPVDYMFTTLPVESVTALYQVADIAFITPIRDGMNLVAKEFIASKPRNDGVLILSETAGAAQELQSALLVNPGRPRTLVHALEEAVSMPKRELKQRLGTMQNQIATHTVQHWAGTFMRSLQKPLPGARRTGRPFTHDRQQDMHDQFVRASGRTLLLDYDGVLTPFVNKPELAKPPAAVIRTLRRLAAYPATEVVIISGRSRADLERWFDGKAVTLVAEHGAYTRKAGSRTWRRTAPADSGWQKAVLPILEEYTGQTPGASVEKKDFSLVWHYRAASPYYAQKNIIALKRLLQKPAKTYGLSVQSGNKILEIRRSGIDKGTTALSTLKHQPDFVLAIGDDYTDEDMFLALPATAITIKVGRGQTAARYRVSSVDQVHALLKKLELISK